MSNRLAIILFLFVLSLSAFATAQEQQLKLDYSKQFEVVLEDNQYVIYVVGPARFSTDSALIYCDSAVWRKGQNVRLNGRVKIDDPKYSIRADSVYYNVIENTSLALGQHVEIWSYEDSIYASGKQAFYDRKSEFFYMEERPILYIGYPDSATMVEVIADNIEYKSTEERAEAIGNVDISSKDVRTHSDCALLHLDDNTLDLFENPTAQRGNSTIKGNLISIYFDNRVLDRIDVIDSAEGEFIEPIDSTNTMFDRSKLTGNRLIFYFKHGQLDNILCYGQAYSWYYPSSRGGTEFHQNSVSGDTIRFVVQNESLEEVDVIGGGIGSYYKGERKLVDSVATEKIDTIDYNAQKIVYDLKDSLITLNTVGHVNSAGVSLDAHLIVFDTDQRLIEAFSASVDTIDQSAYTESFTDKFQPNNIPVRLKDRGDEIYGDYLIYSIDTEKGRIVQSKSNYREGLYYGEKLYREDEKIFYVADGRYTTCDAEEPHFHFHSNNMKLIEGEKLIAKPVVFYIERIPILAIPYYVFPLDRGRHSGFLPFTFGQFERGDRYIKNVGYYWAASDYWDWEGSVDYHELNQNVIFNSRVNFNKRYTLSGYVSGSYLRDTDYDDFTSQETKRNRYTLAGSYNHTITPSFSVRANGSYISDKTYNSDFSLNADDLLERDIKSQASFSKRFGKSTSLTGNVTHTQNLDLETRTDYLPNLSLSLPTIWLFGSGSTNADGKTEQKWYNRFTVRYSPRLVNYSSRVTNDSLILVDVDSVTVDTTEVTWRSRKKYTKIDHNPSLNLPQVKLGPYMNIVPSVRYSETWIKVHETDQSLAAGIDAGETYRTYSWGASVSANTTLYGTVYPNLFGLVGLRHTINPSFTYSYTPDIDRHPAVRSFVGGAAGSTKSQRLGVSLSQTFQAKVKRGEIEKNVELLSLLSSFSHDLENDIRPYSNLSTTFNSQALGRIRFSGRMTHSFYKPNTNDLEFWSPTLLDFYVDANVTIAGKTFLFDEQVSRQTILDSARIEDPTAPQPMSAAPGSPGGETGWSVTARYSFSESGLTTNYLKRTFLDLGLRFKLTPTTSISYSQYYDIGRQLTIRNSVNIVKTIHCWTGSLYWVPIGSNRGFGFKLYVTSIPEIKLDNKHDSFLQSVRR